MVLLSLLGFWWRRNQEVFNDSQHDLNPDAVTEVVWRVKQFMEARATFSSVGL